MFEKILVAVDNNVDKTEIYQHVFDEAVSLAKAMNAHLMLLHVFYPFDDEFLNALVVEPHIVHPTLYMETNKEYVSRLEEWKKQGVDFLKSLNEKAINEGVTTEFTLKAGDAGRMICEVARNWDADLIIVGRRGHTGLSEFLLGSVSNYVLHHAHCSVLTVQGATQAVS
jgi:nucleotide-binding universal stress UspA family protein